MMLFPSNPTHGAIFELQAGSYFKYDATLRSWIKIVSNTIQLALATPTNNGAMSAEDLKKLNRLVLAPPKSSITGTECFAPFSGGNIAFSADKYISVNGDLTLRNIDARGDVISKQQPFKIHQHTNGFDFTVDLPSLIEELKRRNQFNVTGKRGTKGVTGKRGATGPDTILTGPPGTQGASGTTPPCGLSVEPDVLKVVPKTGTNKALVKVNVVKDETDNLKYRLIFDRQAIGPVGFAADKFNVRNDYSSWALAIATDNVTDTPVAECDSQQYANVPMPVYYIDIDPIIESIHQEFLKEVGALKTGYEDIVKYWIQTMSDLFDEQKAALCCALQFCMSSTKGATIRQHIESVAAAASGSANVLLHDRNSQEAVAISGTRLLGRVSGVDACESGPAFPQYPHTIVDGGGGGGGGGGGEDEEPEVWVLTITTPSTGTGAYAVQLNGFTTNVIATNNASIQQTAIEIASHTWYQGPHSWWTGWDASVDTRRGLDNKVTFTARRGVGTSTGAFSLGQAGGGVPAAGTFVKQNSGGGNPLRLQSVATAVATSAIIDPSVNFSVVSGTKINLQPGTYTATISDTTAQVDDDHRANVKIRYSKGGNSKVATFLNKGAYASNLNARQSYVGLSLSFTHDGGDVVAWLPSDAPQASSGQVSLTVTSSTSVPPQDVAKENLKSINNTKCQMSASHLAWYERGWATGNCCGVIVNVMGQDYIIVKRSIGNDTGCGGGESESTPCINKYLKTIGHPAFAWPTFDGSRFAPLPPADYIDFHYDADLHNIVVGKLASGEFVSGKGTPSGLRHLAYQLNAILFPAG